MRAKYHYRDLKPGDAYYSAWQEYRNRKSLALGACTLFIVFGVTGIAFVTALKCFAGGMSLMIGAWLFMMWSIVNEWRWRCPRCSKSWELGRYSVRLIFPRFPKIGRCQNCNLPKWAPDDPDRRQE